MPVFAVRPTACPRSPLAIPWPQLLLCLLLGAAPAVAPALAADAPAAAKDAPAPPDPARKVRPEVAKAVNAARDQLRKEGFKDALEALKPAQAIADLTPYEGYLVRNTQALATIGTGDMAAADPLAEQVAGDSFESTEDRLTLERIMAQRWYDKPPLSQAVRWGRRFLADGGNDDTMHTIIIQSLFKANDWKGTIDELNQVIAAGDAAGKPPTEARLQMLTVCYSKAGDDTGHVGALERLVTLYPKPVYWHNLLANLERKEGFEDYAVLDTYRLRMATDTISDADDFIDWAKLALHAGYPAEAKRALDAGVAKGVLGGGKGGAAYDTLRKQADKATEEDRAALGQGDARVEKLPDGNGLFSSGMNYVSHERYDQGLPMMERGLQRGGLKHPELARLQIGEAYVRAGRKDDALKVFAEVKGSDGSGDLARLWTLFLKGGK